MRLIIIRHGETEENVNHICQGHLPGKLTERGKKQAERVAERLKNEKVDIIYSSDLARTLDTARIVAEKHPEAEFIITEELRERFHGEDQGKHHSQIDWSVQNGEKDKELCARAKKFLDRISKHKDKRIILAGHNAINRALVLVLEGRKVEEYPELKHHEHTEIVFFDGVITREVV